MDDLEHFFFADLFNCGACLWLRESAREVIMQKDE